MFVFSFVPTSVHCKNTSMCAAGRVHGRFLTFATSGKLQPSFKSIKAIKRLSMWMEISMNYHIWGRDRITSSIPSLAVTPSSGSLSQILSCAKGKSQILKHDFLRFTAHIISITGQGDLYSSIRYMLYYMGYLLNTTNYMENKLDTILYIYLEFKTRCIYFPEQMN